MTKFKQTKNNWVNAEWYNDAIIEERNNKDGGARRIARIYIDHSYFREVDNISALGVALEERNPEDIASTLPTFLVSQTGDLKFLGAEVVHINFPICRFGFEFRFWHDSLPVRPSGKTGMEDPLINFFTEDINSFDDLVEILESRYSELDG